MALHEHVTGKMIDSQHVNNHSHFIKDWKALENQALNYMS
jgi:hypothetical protein